MQKVNKYGLSRDIPSAIKREVRQKSGFGCVFCGLFLYTYDHIDPPWPEAREHDPDKICLLCPIHHTLKTNRLIPVEDVKIAYQNPKAKQKGYSHNPPEFAACKRPINVEVGNWFFEDPSQIIRIGNETILALEDLEEGKLALTSRFYDRHSKLILEIDKNEWRAMSGNWDVEAVRNRLTIREKAKKLSMSVIVKSNHHLIFDDIEMRYSDVRLVSKAGSAIEIYYQEQPVMSHCPKEKGGGGVKTRGSLHITESGQIMPILGPTTIRAGTIKMFGGSPNVPGRVELQPNVRSTPKVGRNDPCFCGSGKKYKKCHGS